MAPNSGALLSKLPGRELNTASWGCILKSGDDFEDLLASTTVLAAGVWGKRFSLLSEEDDSESLRDVLSLWLDSDGDGVRLNVDVVSSDEEMDFRLLILVKGDDLEFMETFWDLIADIRAGSRSLTGSEMVL